MQHNMIKQVMCASLQWEFRSRLANQCFRSRFPVNATHDTQRQQQQLGRRQEGKRQLKHLRLLFLFQNVKNYNQAELAAFCLFFSSFTGNDDVSFRGRVEIVKSSVMPQLGRNRTPLGQTLTNSSSAMRRVLLHSTGMIKRR